MRYADGFSAPKKAPWLFRPAVQPAEKGSEVFGRGKLPGRGAIASHVERDFNEGINFLMMAIDMLRNEKSHAGEIGVDEPKTTFQYVILSGLAMRLLDKAQAP